MTDTATRTVIPAYCPAQICRGLRAPPARADRNSTVNTMMSSMLVPANITAAVPTVPAIPSMTGEPTGQPHWRTLTDEPVPVRDGQAVGRGADARRPRPCDVRGASDARSQHGPGARGSG